MTIFNRRAAAVSAAALSALLALSSEAWASRTITDQIGREVTIPDTVNRVAVLQHQTLNLLVQLNAGDKVVGVLASWKKQLGPEFERFLPSLKTMPMPGDLTSASVESLLELKPDVVFVANYAPKDMIDKIQGAGIPVVAVSLRRDAASQKNKMNASMADEETVYNEGLKDGIRMIADVVGRKAEAEDLISYTFKERAAANERVKNIPDDKRVRLYMANPNLQTYGSGKYTGLMMKHSGGVNVAAATVKGARQVSMEQVIAWNPDVIFVQSRYPQVYKEIKSDPKWAQLSAVKNGRVYMMPEYAKAWGYPEPEAMAVGELWMAKKLYPDLYKDVDVDAKAQAYYKRFYRVDWTPAKNAQ
jgi:iron complex transport system substrate-binding protein